MSKNVFANGKGISAKKDDNISRCAMPDVCNSPPSPPAGPVPIPYPNTAKTSDTSDGSKTVKIGGAEVGMKNSSNYKKSTGDEAATKTLGMNLTTHTIQGIMKHAAWSMDVKIEGANVIRHMDLTTHNHMNTSGTGSTTMNQEQEAQAQIEEICEALEVDLQEMFEEDVQTEHYQRSGALANAHYTPATPAGAPGAFMRSASDMGMVINDDGYQPPLPARGQAATRPACFGDDIETRNAGRRTNDAESKILTPISAQQNGGTIVMNITHANPACSPPGQDWGQDRMPCIHCRRAICGAEDCGISVYICTEDGAVSPEQEGLCPPPEGEAATGLGAWDPQWADAGMTCR